MKNDIKIFLLVILFVSSFLVFNLIEFEPLNQAVSKYLQSFMFSMALIVSIARPCLKVKLFYLGFLFIFLMVMFYLSGRLPLSNSFASIGIGIITIVSLTYLPQLVKKGFVPNL